MSEDPRKRVAELLARTRYAMPTREARAQIDARRQRLLADDTAPPAHDFAAAEPLPADPVHDAPGYAAGFWKRKETPKDPPGRPPKGDLSPEHERFRVLDGGKADDGDNEP